MTALKLPQGFKKYARCFSLILHDLNTQRGEAGCYYNNAFKR